MTTARKKFCPRCFWTKIWVYEKFSDSENLPGFFIRKIEFLHNFFQPSHLQPLGNAVLEHNQKLKFFWTWKTHLCWTVVILQKKNRKICRQSLEVQIVCRTAIVCFANTTHLHDHDKPGNVGKNSSIKLLLSIELGVARGSFAKLYFCYKTIS